MLAGEQRVDREPGEPARAPVQDAHVHDPLEEGEDADHHDRHQGVAEPPVSDQDPGRERDGEHRRQHPRRRVPPERPPRLGERDAPALAAGDRGLVGPQALACALVQLGLLGSVGT